MLFATSKTTMRKAGNIQKDLNLIQSGIRVSEQSAGLRSETQVGQGEDPGALDSAFRMFENNHKLVETLNRLASGRPSEEEKDTGFRQRERKDPLRIRFNFTALAEHAPHVRNKKLITDRIIQEFEKAQAKFQESLLYDLVEALARVAAGADENAQEGMALYLRRRILPRILKDEKGTRQNRNVTAVAHALALIHGQASSGKKAEIAKIIQKEILSSVDAALDAVKGKIGLKEGEISELLSGTRGISLRVKAPLKELKMLMMTKAEILGSIGELYAKGSPAELEDSAGFFRDRWFGQVLAGLWDEESRAAALSGLAEAYLFLHRTAPFSAREQAWDWLNKNIVGALHQKVQDAKVKSMALGHIYEEAAALFERVPPEAGQRTFDKIKAEIIAPALSIEDERYRSIALSRIATSLANLSKRQGAVFQTGMKNYLQGKGGLLWSIKTRGQPGHIAGIEPQFEGISKIDRAANSIYTGPAENRREGVDGIISGQEPLWKELAGHEDPLSRLLSGNAHTLAEVCQNGSARDRQYARDAIEKNILPRIFAFKEPRALFRGAARTAVAIALLYKHASPEEKAAAVAFITTKILERALKAAKGETFFLENLIGIYRALNVLTAGERGQAADLENLTPERAAAFAKQLDPERRRKFFVYLGNYASKESLRKHLADPDLSGEDKMGLIYGRLIFEKIFPPFDASIAVYQAMDSKKIDEFAEKISRDEVSAADIYDLSSYVGLRMSLKGWHEIAMNLDFISNDPLVHLILIRNIIVTMRLKSDQGEPWLKALDIENIPHLVRDSLPKIFSDPAMSALAYPDLRLLVRSIPLDSSLINVVRNIINQWYQDAYRKVSYKDKELDSFMEVIRVKLHDSPSPYHLKIVRAYVKYLLNSTEKEDQDALDELNAVLEKFVVAEGKPIKVQAGYAARLKDAMYQGEDPRYTGKTLYEQVRDDATQMRDLFEELYGDTQARGLLRVLQDGQWKESISKESYDEIIGFLNSLSDWQLGTERDISKKIVDAYGTHVMGNFTDADYRLELLRQLVQIQGRLKSEMEKDPANGARRLYLMRVQNMLEPFAFSLINTLRDSWDKLNTREQKDALALCLKLQSCTMAEGPGKKEVEEIIDDLQAIDPQSQPGRYFYQVLTRAERALTLFADTVSVQYQRRAEDYAAMIGFEHENVRNFSANMIRESVLFSVSLLASHAADRFAEENKLSRRHITRTGAAKGRLVWVPVLDQNTVSTLGLATDDVLVTENIPDDIAMPRVAAILTRQVEDSLSHLAIMAGYYGIPWANLSPKEFERLKARAEGNPQVAVTISQTNVSVRTAKKVEKPAAKEPGTPASSAVSGEKPKTSSPVPAGGPIFLKPEEYTRGRSGTKAYNLATMRDAVPGRVPEHISSPFEYFRGLIDNDPTLTRLVEELSQFRDPQSIQDNRALVMQKLEAMQAYINEKLKISEADQEELLQGIGRNIGEMVEGRKLILRSTTSVEDLAKYPAAGVYESRINANLEELINDFKWVFSQFYSMKAFEERRRQGFDEKNCFPGILIQELVEADYSFVIHTRDPNSPNPDEMIVEIAVGLGPALMTGKKEYAGTAHSFSCNIRTGEIKRLSYANKSVKVTSKGDRLVGYATDELSLTDIPSEIDLKQVFEAATRIKEGKVGNGADQDIEGVIVRLEAKKIFKIVQSRNQTDIPEPVRESEPAAEEVAEPEETVPAVEAAPVPDLKTHPPLFCADPDGIGLYDLPFEGSGVNLVQLWIEAFASVVGPGKVVVTPFGSLSYMIRGNNKLAWENIKDIDLNFYLTDKRTREDAFVFKKRFLKQVKESFIKLAKEQGLQVQVSTDGQIALKGRIGEKVVSFEMKDDSLHVLQLNEISRGRITRYSGGAFLPWHRYFGDAGAMAKLGRLFQVERDLTPEQAIANVESQYQLVYARVEEEKDPMRTLREMIRMSWILDDEGLRRDAFAKMDVPEKNRSKAWKDEVEALWKTLPRPGSVALKEKSAAQVGMKFGSAQRVVRQISEFLDAHQMAPGPPFYYSFSREADFKSQSQFVACALLKAYFQGGKSFGGISQFQDKVIVRLKELLKEAAPAMTDAEIDAKVADILETSYASFSRRGEDTDFKKRQAADPKLYAREDLSRMDITMSMILSHGFRLSPRDLVVIDHIDMGSTLALLPLWLSMGPYDPAVMRLIQEAADLDEKPDPGNAVRRVNNGDLALAQRIAYACRKIISEIKKTKPGEAEALQFLRGDGTPEGSILGRMRRMIVDAQAGNLGRVRELSDGAYRRLSDEYKKLNRSKESGRLKEVYEVSPGGNVVSVHGKQGIQDITDKYHFAPEATEVLISYDEAKGKGGVFMGWRYSSVGRQPGRKDIDLSNLPGLLNRLEVEISGQPKTHHVQQWYGLANNKVVVFGPAGNAADNASLIPPDVLREIIELYLTRLKQAAWDETAFWDETHKAKIFSRAASS